jgi:Novel STAND NTPase 1
VSDSFSSLHTNLVDARLLTSTKRRRAGTVEVAHEALLRQWRPLREAIEAGRTWLQMRSELEHEAVDWDQGERDESCLLLRGGDWPGLMAGPPRTTQTSARSSISSWMQAERRPPKSSRQTRGRPAGQA